jgi:hypothetical protein
MPEKTRVLLSELYCRDASNSRAPLYVKFQKRFFYNSEKTTRGYFLTVKAPKSMVYKKEVSERQGCGYYWHLDSPKKLLAIRAMSRQFHRLGCDIFYAENFFEVLDHKDERTDMRWSRDGRKMVHRWLVLMNKLHSPDGLVPYATPPLTMIRTIDLFNFRDEDYCHNIFNAVMSMPNLKKLVVNSQMALLIELRYDSSQHNQYTNVLSTHRNRGRDCRRAYSRSASSRVANLPLFQQAPRRAEAHHLRHADYLPEPHSNHRQCQKQRRVCTDLSKGAGQPPILLPEGSHDATVPRSARR